MGLAICDLSILQLSRAQNHEERIAVEFDFRTLMRFVGVLNREIVQAELLLGD